MAGDCCSSIGLAKAALEGLNGANMFGETGAHWSVVFVDIDAHYRNRTTLDAILPRESASKVTYPRKWLSAWQLFQRALFPVTLLLFHCYKVQEYTQLIQVACSRV